MSNQELSIYIAKYEVIIKREESLQKFKEGFDILNIIRVCIFFLKKKKGKMDLNKNSFFLNSYFKITVGTKFNFHFTKN